MLCDVEEEVMAAVEAGGGGRKEAVKVQLTVMITGSGGGEL